MPYFSVVIPTYNRAGRLRNTLRSVVEQTFPDFEILVMDDGSIDNTRDVVDGFADERIKYSWAENSGGPATPRNRGIIAASAEWVCFLDADDVWYPQKLEETKRVICADSSVTVICNNEVLVYPLDGRRRKLTHGPFEPDFYRVMLTKGNRCSTSAMTVRKSFLDRHGLRFNTAAEYVIVEDYDLWLRLAMAGASFKFVDQVLGEYVVESDNISLNEVRSLDNLETLLRDHVFDVQTFEPDKRRLWRQVSVRLSLARARHLVAGDRYGAAIALAARTLAGAPVGTVSCLLSGAGRALGRRIA